MPPRTRQNEVDAAHALLRTPATRCRDFVDVTDLYALNRPGRPSASEARRPTIDFDARDLLVGSTLRRTFLGIEQVVYVVPPPPGAPAHWYARGWGRYVYRGERHKSLTSVARAIVGAADPRVSGNRFFGLRRRRDRWFDDGVRWVATPNRAWEVTAFPIIAYAPALIVASGRHAGPSARRNARNVVPSRSLGLTDVDRALPATENPA